MAWITGSSDVANFASDLYFILTGQMSSMKRGSGQVGNGRSAGSDAWDAIDNTNYVIRAPVGHTQNANGNTISNISRGTQVCI